MADGANPSAAELAREVNGHILELHARLHEISAHALEPDEDTIGFVCECGCMRLVTSTRTDYSHDGGVWLEGHRP